jgi:hypothetical protein
MCYCHSLLYEPCETCGYHSSVVDDSSFLLITPRRIVNIPMFRRHCCPKRIKLFSGRHDVPPEMIWICMNFTAVFFFLWRCRTNRASGHLIVEVCRSDTIRHARAPVWTFLNGWPVGCRGRYLHNTHRTQETKVIALSAFKLAIPAVKHSLTHAFRLLIAQFIKLKFGVV